MATFTRSQKLLVSACAAALGGAALLMLPAGNVVTVSGAGATAADASSPFAGPDFPVCHTPASTGVPNMMLRLAQTEVPRAEMSAATLRAGLRGHRAAAVGRPRLHRLQDHHRERARAGLFRSGPAPRLRVQSRRGAARVPHGAEARSRLRHVLLGRGAGARPQHQSSDAGGRGRAGLRRRAEGEGAGRQGEPARAGADRRARGALRQRSEGRPRAARRGLRGRNGEGRGAVSRRRRDRHALRRGGDGSQPLGLLEAGRPRTQPAERADRADARARARPQPEPSRRDPLLHPCRRGVRPAQARRALCRPACAARSPAPAISCTCRATSTIGSAAISTRWRTTRPRSRSTKNTWPTPTRRWASIGSATIRTTCTS